MSCPSAPRHVSPSQWLRANRLPSAKGHYVRARSYPPASINLRLSPTRVRRSHGLAKNPFPVPLVLAWSPRPFPPIHAWSHPPAPISTRSRSTRLHFYQRATARSTSARPQSFPVGAPCSRKRPQQYIMPFAPPHKSLCS
jgi:hypothetical protein